MRHPLLHALCTDLGLVIVVSLVLFACLPRIPGFGISAVFVPIVVCNLFRGGR
jgi:hypothetical protein